MSRHAQENMASVLLLTVFIGIIWLCQDFGPRARLIPLPLAVAGIVLTLIQFVWHNFGSTEELQIEMISVEAPEMPAVEAPLERITQKKSAWRSESGAYGMVAILVAMVFILGLMPTAFLFTAGYFLLTGYCSLWPSLLYAGLLTGSMYLLFVVALQMQMYHGLLAPLFS